MKLRIELEREDDGRWVAEVVALPGVLAYGAGPEEAVRTARGLADQRGLTEAPAAPRLRDLPKLLLSLLRLSESEARELANDLERAREELGQGPSVPVEDWPAPPGT